MEIRRETQGGEAVKHFPFSIAVGDYADDLHNCHAPDDFESGLDSLGDDPPGFRSGPFQVPFGALIPDDVNGLLAAEKNVSVSRLVNGATRLQPITMLTGQVAGALAAGSILQGVVPREVDWTQLQLVLLRSGSILASSPMTDMPQGTLPWQAAQLAITHRWIETADGEFHPGKTLTRNQAAVLVTVAYALAEPVGTFGPDPRRLQSSFQDVPLYDEASASVEALQAHGITLTCKGVKGRFCGHDAATRADFLSWVQTLEAEVHPGITADELATAVQPELDQPITRSEAAILLYTAIYGRTAARGAAR